MQTAHPIGGYVHDAIDNAPIKGVLPLPLSALKSGAPVLRNPANRHKAIALTFEQFQYGWANNLDEVEARKLYDTYHVPASGEPLFEAGFANFMLHGDTKVDVKKPEPGTTADHLWHQRHHRPPGIHPRQLRKAAKEPPGDRIRRNRRPRALPDPRPRLARRRSPRTHLHPTIPVTKRHVDYRTTSKPAAESTM
jgi:hypothetical protein